MLRPYGLLGHNVDSCRRWPLVQRQDTRLWIWEWWFESTGANSILSRVLGASARRYRPWGDQVTDQVGVRGHGKAKEAKEANEAPPFFRFFRRGSGTRSSSDGLDPPATPGDDGGERLDVGLLVDPLQRREVRPPASIRDVFHTQILPRRGPGAPEHVPPAAREV